MNFETGNSLKAAFPSLVGLPTLTVDEFGNINVSGNNPPANGLRHRYQFVKKLPLKHLRQTKLTDLLGWMRWGSKDGSMWECSMGEIIQIIERWEKANPNATLDQYGLKKQDLQDCSWDEVVKQSYAAKFFHRRRCNHCKRYHKQVAPWLDCHRCGHPWHESTDVISGPRGLGTYNLILIGLDGYYLVGAAYRTRYRKSWRKIPENLREVA